MARDRTAYLCSECGAGAPRWLGRCPACGEWGTLVEEEINTTRAVPGLLPADAPRPVPIGGVDPMGADRSPTGLGELDRVLGGGLVPGSVTLLGGEPGMGKSTLLIQTLANRAHASGRVLLVTGEESRQQVRLRAERVGALADGLLLLAETSLPLVLAHVDAARPDLLAIDSIQAVSDPEVGSVAGSVSQVRECAHRLARVAKERVLTTLLVGHVTKEGTLAGPRALEHVVDTVLSFDGERHHSLRLLHALKHRFGSTRELGLFEMTERGLVDVPDPSALFLADRRPGTPGSVVAPVLEGTRPLLVEVQALVHANEAPIPRRNAQGIDGRRLSILLAVLERRAGVPVARADVYASVAGGVRVSEAGADLALALAVASAARDVPVPADLVVVGEVGLGGEIRQVAQGVRRLAEAARLGFRRALVPGSTPDVPGLRLIRVGDVRCALEVALGLGDGSRRRRAVAA